MAKAKPTHGKDEAARKAIKALAEALAALPLESQHRDALDRAVALARQLEG